MTFIYKETTESTNNDIKILAKKGAKEGTVVVAEHQSAGKGRLGKSFYSPKGSGIYFSLLLRPECAPKSAYLITVAASVAVRRALFSLYNVKTQIKWVNDLYFNGKKFCGILTESEISQDGKSLNYAVLGIGINLTVPKDSYPEEFAYKTTALSEFVAFEISDKERLISEIIKEFNFFYKKLEKKEYLDEYKKASIVLGRKIKILSGEFGGMTATAEDIDNSANLIVKTDDGKILTLGSGDVSIFVNQ